MNSTVITNGLFYGGGLKLLGLQFTGTIFTIVFVSVLSIIIITILSKLFKNDVGVKRIIK